MMGNVPCWPHLLLLLLTHLTLVSQDVFEDEDWAGQNSTSAGLILSFWQSDLQATAQSISPEKSIIPLIHSDSHLHTVQRVLTHLPLLNVSSGLVLLQEMQNLAMSAPFRLVNTICHHLSRHREENADTSRPHYFTVLKHLDIRSLQCSKAVTSLTQCRPTKGY